jgi:hypothetical protein
MSVEKVTSPMLLAAPAAASTEGATRFTRRQ